MRVANCASKEAVELRVDAHRDCAVLADNQFESDDDEEEAK